MDRRIFAAALALLVPARALGVAGAADGRVSIMAGSDRAYGFSAYSGNWTMTPLDAVAQSASVGTYLGFVRTATKIYAFNSTNDHWYSTSLTDTPTRLDGQDVEGATAIAWSFHHAYGIATPWSLWRSIWWQTGEHCLGGGSAGSFAIVWTNVGTHAYSSSSGQWYSRALGESAVGGIASNGIGIVWTANDAYAFDPLDMQWVAIDLGDPFGVSASGGGNTAVVWSHDRAQAYSAILNQWVPTGVLIDIIGGAAGGDVAMVWGNDWACSFVATTGMWSQISFPGPSGVDDAPDLVGAGLRVAPNPSPDGHLGFSLSGDAAMTLQIFDATGARVVELNAPSNGRDASTEWNGRDSDGRRVAAGTYWAVASTRNGSEARRIVILP